MSFSNFKIGSGNTLKYESIMGDISRDLNKYARDAVNKAGKHVEKKLKEKCEQKFGKESNITEGIGKKSLKGGSTVLVGVGPPAQAAHLIEFGTDERYQKSGKYTGKIQKDPFVFPTYEQEAPEVKRILSQEWF